MKLAPGCWAVIYTANVCYECSSWEKVLVYGTKEQCMDWLTTPNRDWYYKDDNLLLAEIKDMNREEIGL